jgi:uncharacterized Zn-binding protein involved in type VI secretion
LLVSALLLIPAPSLAQSLPACANTGAASVMFNGKPALKLADVATCPAGSFEIIPNAMIGGQPMVHFNTGIGGFVADAGPHVMVDGKAVTSTGDVSCQ